MNKWHKKYRLILQILFFLFCLGGTTSLIKYREVVEIYNSFHIFTSFVSWMNLSFTFPYIIITLFVLFSPLLLGRLYCAFLCPVGFLQDIAFKFWVRLSRRKIRRSNKHIPSILIFILTVFLILNGLPYFGYIDHISNFSRIFAVFKHFSLPMLGVVVVFLSFILILPRIYPRWFCLNLCPSGAMFSLVDEKKGVRPAISKVCNSCGKCELSCPTLAIKKGEIDYNKCLNCLDCIDSCPKEAIQLVFPFRPFKKGAGFLSVLSAPFRTDRRNFFVGMATGFVAVLGSIEAVTVFLGSKVKASIVPPGANSIKDFWVKCTGCHQCISSCPTGVLVPSVEGLLTPKMNYDSSYCEYECNACLSVCPTKAISYYPLDVKKQISIGKAKIDKETCIPYIGDKDCAACAEHCPSGAVDMHKEGDIYVPVIDEHFCIGCGACQYACPVDPVRAIQVIPEEIHSIAYSPRKKSQKQKNGDIEEHEFPF